MRNDKPNLIVDLTLTFAVEVIEFCERLESKSFIKNNKFK